MKIQYSRLAQRDLTKIREYYGDVSSFALQNITSDILNTVEDIPTSILKGRKTPIDTVWERLTRQYKYVIPYIVIKDVVWVLRVYDQRRGNLPYHEIEKLVQSLDS